MQAVSRTRQSAVGAEELPADEPLPVRVGELVGGKYRVQRVLGVGGMGIVAAAEHEGLGQHVALKIMRTARKTPETVERFLREARAAVRLKSSHVAKVRDVGTLPNGLPYMVMDLLEGSDLFTVLQERGPLPVADAIDYILQACDAISEAHAAGIIHRDLKPENLFLTTRRDGTPHVRVLDFGISKIVPAGGEAPQLPSGRSVTHESAIMGSPSYMSPEQIRAPKTVDERTDIWALGCTLFELLTNQEAFGADNAPDIFVRVLEKPPPPLEQMRPDLPPGLPEVVDKCLQKNRDDRYESIDAFASALSSFSPKRSMSMPPRWRDYIQVDVDLDELDPAVAKMVKPPRKATAQTFVLPGRVESKRKRTVWVLAALTFVLSAAGAMFFFKDALFAAARRARSEPATPAATATTRTVDAPRPTPSATATSVAPPEASAAPAAPEATPSVTPSAQPSAQASAAPVAKGTRRPPAGTRPVSAKTTSTSATTSTPAAVTATASPEPTSHRRTDW